MTPLADGKQFKTHSWSSIEHSSNFLFSFRSFLINFLDSFFKHCFSLSVIVFAKTAKLCWKHLIVSIKVTWLSIFAKFILVRFLFTIEMPMVLQDPDLTPFKNKKTSKPNRLWAVTLILFWFSLTFKLRKLWAYQ